MALSRANLIRQRLIKSSTRSLSAQSQPVSSDEYTEKAIYPEILDTSIESRKARESEAWHEQIRNVKTVEEKLIKINMPRYYGYKTVMLSDQQFPYNCLPVSQHYTRTVFEAIQKLPDAYKTNDDSVNSLVDLIKAQVVDAVEYSNEYFIEKYSGRPPMSPQETERALGQIIIEQINRALINSLSPDFYHLSEVDVDINPRHEAFWLVGGVNPPKNVVRSKEGRPWQKEKANDQVDRPVQFIGEPYLALRHRLPLDPIATEEQSSNPENISKVPVFPYDARTVGYTTNYRHGTSIPGFWPGNPNNFGILSYQKRDHLLTRKPKYGPDDFQEALHAQAIQSSFTWTLAQAYYLGFTTFNDLTYPINTQTIISNGRDFSFYLYQLNTSLIHSHHHTENPKVNFCWGTNELKLYEEIDDKGKCVGFNDDVLRMLVHFYANKPAERDIDLRPYLGENEQKIADIKDDDRREFLERVFKHMTSNRPRHLAIPEIYAWEKIYKIDNSTRSLEAKRRFFELGINPWKRTMDQHTPVYIPRGLRAEGPKSKKKWKQTYYP